MGLSRVELLPRLWRTESQLKADVQQVNVGSYVRIDHKAGPAM